MSSIATGSASKSPKVIDHRRHGLNTYLRGLKEYTDNITAIVTRRG